MSVVILAASSEASSEVTWEDARDKVRRDLWRPSESGLPDDQVDRALHSALLELEAERRWLWLEGVGGSITMESDADNIALPASIKSITSLAVLNGTTGYDILTQKPIQLVRQLARGATAGMPTFYGLSDRTLYFDCAVPDETEFEAIFSTACPRYLVDAIATPPVTLSLQTPAIVALAASHAAMTYLKDEAEAARMRSAYDRILDRLFVEEDTARADASGGGCIQPDDTFHLSAFGER